MGGHGTVVDDGRRSAYVEAVCGNAGAGGGGAAHAGCGFSFVQISDSHIGFNKAANQDVAGTLKLAIDKINAMPATPDLLLHTGDITQSAKAGGVRYGAADYQGCAVGEVHYVPGEHDTATDDGALYLERYGKGTVGSWLVQLRSQGVHFIGLNNSQQMDAMGGLGAEQLSWLKTRLASRSASTPIVVFAHIPLWMVYPEWGWGTKDGAEALSYLKRFGSVTVLNGHIHQDGAEGGRQCLLSYGDIDRVSAAGSRVSAPVRGRWSCPREG